MWITLSREFWESSVSFRIPQKKTTPQAIVVSSTDSGYKKRTYFIFCSCLYANRGVSDNMIRHNLVCSKKLIDSDIWVLYYPIGSISGFDQYVLHEIFSDITERCYHCVWRFWYFLGDTIKNLPEYDFFISLTQQWGFDWESNMVTHILLCYQLRTWQALLLYIISNEEKNKSPGGWTDTFGL